MKCPNIYVVIDGGSRDLNYIDPQAWFFNEREAEEWREKNQPSGHFWEIYEVFAPTNG